MIHIPALPLQTMTVQMAELSIGQALAIAAMPIHLKEASTTAFLRSVVQSPDTDPADWTVEERMMCVAHYLAATADDGPDFAVGNGRFSDYLLPDDKPRLAMVEAGDLLGDVWHVRQLSGQLAEAIERTAEDGAFAGHARWLVGRMACQMVRAGEEHPAGGGMTAGEVDTWLSQRLQVFAAFPESDFMALLLAFESSRPALTHLFQVASDDTGMVALSKGGAGLTPARFPVRSCVGEWAASYAGKPD